jgi:hypothetical protein
LGVLPIPFQVPCGHDGLSFDPYLLSDASVQFHHALTLYFQKLQTIAAVVHPYDLSVNSFGGGIVGPGVCFSVDNVGIGKHGY